MFETYKPSGRFGPMTIVFFLLGLILVVGMAFVYHLGLEFVPFIYLSFLMTVVFGVGISRVGTFIVNHGHCRNLLLTVFISLTLFGSGMVAKHYFQYRSLMANLAGELIDKAVSGNRVSRAQAEASRPELIKELHSEISFIKHFEVRANTGISIGRLGNNGAPITGIVMYILWLVEAGMVFYFGFRAPVSAAGEPYSEKMGAWADEVDEVMMLPITSEEMILQIKSATSVEELLEIPIPKTDESTQFAVYNVNSVPGQEMEDAYLTVNLMTLSVNKEGEVKSDIKPLVKHAILTTARRLQLVENAELLNEAMEAYRAAGDEEEELSEGLPVSDLPDDDS